MLLSDRTKEMVKTIDFYDDGKYVFTVDNTIIEDRAKKVYTGYFDASLQNSAPGKCVLGKKYCLKTATIVFPMDSFSHPQQRHFWDFVFFEGANIREILASNSDTKSLNKDIKDKNINIFNNNNGNTSTGYKCMIIEPLYEKVNVTDFKTPLEKIDCIKQIIEGLKQLMSSEIIVNANITAHRDLKFSNVMIEKKEDEKRVIRLIDFPSIKMNSADSSVADVDKTSEGAFSYSNTTPEDILSEFDVTEKNDVFVLGCMFLEIFEACVYEEMRNPLYIMFKKRGLDLKSKINECAAFYRWASARYAHGSSSQSWLEQVLENHDIYIHWNKFGACADEVKRLFYDSTAINPNNRITLTEFESRLKIIEGIFQETPHNYENISEKVIFLIDVKELDKHRDVFFEKIKKIMKTKWTSTEPMLVGYDWVSSEIRLQPSTGTLNFFDMKPICTPDDLDDALKFFMTLNNSGNPGSLKSSLKGCLYEVIEYMNGKNCCSDLYIFTHVAPIEDNMCKFECVETTAFGTTVIRSLSAREIIKKHKDLHVHVYTNNSVTENWYSCEFFLGSDKPTNDDYEKPEPAIKFSVTGKQSNDEPEKKTDEDQPFKFIITGGKHSSDND